jgi:hypothetical protein
VHRAGALLGAWENHVTLVLSKTALVDYTDSGGYQHHVAQLAIINADSSLTDTRRQRTHGHYWDEILDPPTPEGIGALPETAYKPRTDSLNTQERAVEIIKNKDMNTCKAGEFGLYETATCANSPPSAGSYFYCETKATTHTFMLTQFVFGYDNNGGVMAWRNIMASGSPTGSEWCEVYDTHHKPAPADIDAAPAVHTHPGSALNPIELGTEDLNTITRPGFYIQGSNGNTSFASNYPTLQAGSLRVEGGGGPKQTYHVYNSSLIYTRAQYGTGAFTSWELGYNSQNKPTAADVGASPINHTHSPASLGAAPTNHTHTPPSIGAAYNMRPFTNGMAISPGTFTQFTVNIVSWDRIYPLTFAIPSAQATFWVVNRGGENADRDYDFGVRCSFDGGSITLTAVGTSSTLSAIYMM